MLTTNFKPPIYLDADPGAGGEPPVGDPPAPILTVDKPTVTAPATPETWEAYLASLPVEKKAVVESLYTGSVKGLKSALDAERATNKEHAAKLKRLADLEAEEQKRKEAAMSEHEKILAELERHKLAAQEAQAETERISAESASQALKTAVLLKASEMGFEHPEDAYALADLASIETDDKGKYSNLEEVLEPIKARLPVRSTKSTIPKLGPTNPGAGGTQAETDAQKRARLFGSPTDVFDPVVMRQKGGGAFIVEKE